MRHITIIAALLLLVGCGSTKSHKTEVTSSTSSNATAIDSSSSTKAAQTTKTATTITTERATTTATIAPAVVQGEAKPGEAQTIESDDLKVVLMPTPTGSMSVTAFRKPVEVPVHVDRVTTQATTENATEAKSESQKSTTDWASAGTVSEVEETKARASTAYTWSTLAGVVLLSLLFLYVLRRERKP